MKNKLKKKKGDQKRAQKARDEKKKTMKALLEENPELHYWELLWILLFTDRHLIKMAE